MRREIVKIGNKFEKIAKQDEESIVSTIIGNNLNGKQMSRLLNASEKFRKDKVLPLYFEKSSIPHEIVSTDEEEEEAQVGPDLTTNFRRALRKKIRRT